MRKGKTRRLFKEAGHGHAHSQSQSQSQTESDAGGSREIAVLNSDMSRGTGIASDKAGGRCICDGLAGVERMGTTGAGVSGPEGSGSDSEGVDVDVDVESCDAGESVVLALPISFNGPSVHLHSRRRLSRPCRGV